MLKKSGKAKPKPKKNRKRTLYEKERAVADCWFRKVMDYEKERNMPRYKLDWCPFCGIKPTLKSYKDHGPNKKIYLAIVKCSGCMASIARDSTLEVVQAWNRREL